MGLEMSGFELNASCGGGGKQREGRKKTTQKTVNCILTVIAEPMLLPAGLNLAFSPILFKNIFSCVNNVILE